MAHENQHVKEARAYEAWADWFAQAQEIRKLFTSANLPLPPPLQRVLGEGQAERYGAVRAHIPPPDSPPKPDGAGEDWISISTTAANPTTLLLAILRQRGGLPSREIVAHLTRLQPSVNPGSVFNIFTRLDGKRLGRTDDGWQLIDPASAPV